jgi:hypothetical protein
MPGVLQRCNIISENEFFSPSKIRTQLHIVDVGVNAGRDIYE